MIFLWIFVLRLSLNVVILVLFKVLWEFYVCIVLGMYVSTKYSIKCSASEQERVHQPLVTMTVQWQ
jgi:hypothetical protein